MRALVVGTGSVGRRHIANLQQLGVDVRAFSYRVARGQDSPAVGCPLVMDWQQAIENVDAVVVANNAELHVPCALKAATAGKAIFVEKPLSVHLKDCAKLLQLTEQNSVKVEAGFTLRAHPNLRWMLQYLQNGSLGELHYIRASVGQFLPDWRPGTDYTSGYAASYRTGGGVILDLIHELDLVQWLGGKVSQVQAMTRQGHGLRIPTDTVAQMTFRTDAGVLAQVHLDYLRPAYRRSFEIVGTTGCLTWDYVKGEVWFEDKTTSVLMHQVPPGFERNQMFLSHMKHFIDRVSGIESEALSPLTDSISALQLALTCHWSAQTGQLQRPSQLPEDFSLPGD